MTKQMSAFVSRYANISGLTCLTALILAACILAIVPTMEGALRVNLLSTRLAIAISHNEDGEILDVQERDKILFVDLIRHNSSSLTYLLSVFMHSTGDNDTAMELLGRLPPDYRASLVAFQSAVFAYPQGLTEETILLWRRVNGIQWFLGNAALAESAGNTSEAEHLLQDAYKVFPSERSISMEMGQFAYRQKNWALAEQVFRATASRDHSDAEAQFWLGKSLLEQHKFLGAALAGIEASKLDPTDPWKYVLVGNSFRLSGGYAEAQVWYEKSVQLSSTPSIGYKYLGINAVEGGNASAALNWLKHVQPNSDTERAELHYWLGRALAKLGRHDEAVAHYLLALEIRSDVPVYQLMLARSLVSLGHTNEAIEAYQHAVVLAPNDSTIRQELAALQIEN